MIKLMRLFGVLAALLMPLPSFALLDLDNTTKSLYFAGRCMAPVLLREQVNTKDLREMPVTAAVPHLYGQEGRVWFGGDESVVLIELAEGASCGINVFDEDLDTVKTFMSYWMDRDDSPFTEINTEVRENGDVHLIYDGFCEDCGYHVHARAYWIKEAQFTLYRVFATLPEKA